MATSTSGLVGDKGEEDTQHSAESGLLAKGEGRELVGGAPPSTLNVKPEPCRVQLPSRVKSLLRPCSLSSSRQARLSLLVRDSRKNWGSLVDGS